MNKKLTLLLVDDEINILNAMRRLLKREPYHLVVADNPQKAIKFAKEHTIDIVITDMRMPGLNGDEFLAQLTEIYPECYRIMMSGFVNTEVVLSALNRGHIHRFIQKPCDNDTLIEAIREGAQRVNYKLERASLINQLDIANKKLKENNHSLEIAVEKRTEKLKASLESARSLNEATRKTLYNLMVSIPYVDTIFVKNVARLCEKLAVRLGVSGQALNDLKYAGFIHQLGMVSLDPKVFSSPFSALSTALQDAYLLQSRNAHQILTNSSTLKPVTEIVINQFEYVNGKGYPNKLNGNQIPQGAKILAVARDFYRYHKGLVTAEKFNVNTICKKLEQYAGLQYCPDVVNALKQEVDPKVEVNDGSRPEELWAGMIVAESLYDHNNKLIIPRGEVLEQKTIDRLKDLESRFNTPLYVVTET